MKNYLKLFITVIISLITSTHSDAIKIVDGWTWKYEAPGDAFGYIFEYMFDGTEVINGKEYHLFKNTLGQKIIPNYMEGGYYYYDIELSLPWYVRQEDGKFYVYPNWEKRGIDRWDMLYEASDTDDSEILLYDFSAPTGEEYRCCQGSVYEINATIGNPVKVIDNGTPLECKEIKYQISSLSSGSYEYTFPPLIVSEDFGILDHGFLTFFIMAPTSGDHHTTLGPTIFHTRLTLQSVKDEQGNVIYDSNPFASSPELRIDQLPSTPIFDLHGREVSNPLPGSIYIHNGKKFVAK